MSLKMYKFPDDYSLDTISSNLFQYGPTTFFITPQSTTSRQPLHVAFFGLSSFNWRPIFPGQALSRFPHGSFCSISWKRGKPHLEAKNTWLFQVSHILLSPVFLTTDAAWENLLGFKGTSCIFDSESAPEAKKTFFFPKNRWKVLRHINGIRFFFSFFTYKKGRLTLIDAVIAFSQGLSLSGHYF